MRFESPIWCNASLWFQEVAGACRTLSVYNTQPSVDLWFEAQLVGGRSTYHICK